ESSLINRAYFRNTMPDDVRITVHGLSETSTTWNKGGVDHPCNSRRTERSGGGDDQFFTELLTGSSGDLIDSPEDGDTVYLLVATFLGGVHMCSDGSYPSLTTVQGHVGDEHDIDFDCLGHTVPAGQRGYCLLPLTVTENGTRLR